MTDRTISLRQLMTVLFLALFPLGTEQLPGRLSAVGAAAWLCPILAGGIAVALVALLGRSPVLGQGDLGQADCQRWGQEDRDRVLAGLFLLWGLYLTAAHAARIGQPPVRFSPGLPHPDYRRGAASGRMDGLWGAARLCPGL